MQADAISNHREDMLPDIDCYTALMNSFIEEQRRLISAVNLGTSEIKSDGKNHENFAESIVF